MDGIVLDRDTNPNATLIYNPRNKPFYRPDSCRIDPQQLPSLVYPTISYDGGLSCSLYRDSNPAMAEQFPPGTRVEKLDSASSTMESGIVMDIPLDPSQPHDKQAYMVQFDDGTSLSVLT